MKLVIDTSAVLSFLLDEKGADEYQSRFANEANSFFANNLTLFEIKLVLMKLGRPRDEIAAALTHVKGMAEILEVSESIALRAAEIKHKYLEFDKGGKEKANLSMADALLVAMAEENNAAILTADKKLRSVTEVRVLP